MSVRSSFLAVYAPLRRTLSSLMKPHGEFLALITFEGFR